jgi:small-conductance mechanosensitive channel
MQTVSNQPSVNNRWLSSLLKLFIWPVVVIAISYAIYISVSSILPRIVASNSAAWQSALYTLLQIMIIGSISWLFIRLINRIQQILQSHLEAKSFKIAALIAPFVANSMKAIILLALGAFLVGFLPLPPQYVYLTDKITSILIISVITWIILKLINLTEQFIVLRYNMRDETNLLAQKARTQIIIIKRILIAVTIVLALGSSLMLFDNVRELGTSILASAGLAGAVAVLATQKYFSSLIIGLQIALNQPIKINDYVVVENEFGQIEEITLSHVIIKIWDLRRLIVPINYFVEKPFQNLSRQSTALLGAVMLYVDYTLPIDALKQELTTIINASPLWNKEVCTLQVTDSKETTMEIRVLISARNPGDTWNLRCEIREKLINYILKKYPQCLPRARLELSQYSS